MTSRQSHEIEVALAPTVNGEAVERGEEAVQQRRREIPVIGRQPPLRAGGMPVENAAPLLKRGAQSVEAARGRRTAQHADFKRPRRALDRFARPPQAHVRMGEERQHTGGVKVERGGVGGEPRQPSGRAVGQRQIGRVFDRHAPAGEFGRDARRQRAVRRHQRGGAARRFQRLAQRDRHGEGFLALIVRFDQFQAKATCFGELAARIGRHRGPAVGGVGRAQGLREQAGAGRAGLIHGPERLYLGLACSADAPSRVGAAWLAGGHAPGRSPHAPGGAADGVPTRLVEALVEAWQDDGPVRQPRDGGEERSGGRQRAGRSRRNDRRRGPLAPRAGPPRPE